MIAHLHGTVAQVGADDVIIDVGGVGMRVLSVPETTSALTSGHDVTLQTSLVVREDSLTLYGFAETVQRDLFELVQTASGVGPKVARAMLSVLSPEQLTSAIVDADTATLTTVPGIGRKGADRIIIELRDRVNQQPISKPAPASGRQAHTQVVEALNGLGWSTSEAAKAVDAVQAEFDTDQNPEVSAMLRRALQLLSRAQ